MHGDGLLLAHYTIGPRNNPSQPFVFLSIRVSFVYRTVFQTDSRAIRDRSVCFKNGPSIESFWSKRTVSRFVYQVNCQVIYDWFDDQSALNASFLEPIASDSISG